MAITAEMTALQPQNVAVLQVLQSVPLRSWANQMAYYDKQTLATEDAMRIGRLHTFLPGRVPPGCACLHILEPSPWSCQHPDSCAYPVHRALVTGKAAITLQGGRMPTLPS